MRSILRRRPIEAVFLLVLVALAARAFVTSRQRAAPLNARAVVSRAGGPMPRASIGPERLVFLEISDFAYSRFVEGCSEELRYDGFFRAGRGGLSLVLEPHSPRQVTVDERTRLALNLDLSDSARRLVPTAFVVDRLPWRYTTRGAFFWGQPQPPHGLVWGLRHRFAITHVGEEGSVLVAAGGRWVTLQPGGAVKIERSLGWWRSSVTIRHRGVYEKARVRVGPAY